MHDFPQAIHAFFYSAQLILTNKYLSNQQAEKQNAYTVVDYHFLRNAKLFTKRRPILC